MCPDCQGDGQMTLARYFLLGAIFPSATSCSDGDAPRSECRPWASVRSSLPAAAAPPPPPRSRAAHHQLQHPRSIPSLLLPLLSTSSSVIPSLANRRTSSRFYCQPRLSLFASSPRQGRHLRCLARRLSCLALSLARPPRPSRPLPCRVRDTTSSPLRCPIPSGLRLDSV